MTKVTEKNVTGVESYDHRWVKTWPEYHALRVAMDAMVHRVNRAIDNGESPNKYGGQKEWLRQVGQMAASLSYSDSAGHPHPEGKCEKVIGAHGIWPYRTEVDGDQLRGWYRCPGCGAEWTCGYAVNIARFM